MSEAELRTELEHARIAAWKKYRYWRERQVEAQAKIDEASQQPDGPDFRALADRDVSRTVANELAAVIERFDEALKGQQWMEFAKQ